MRTLLLSILFAASATALAYECTTNYITQPNGKMLICTTCCSNGVCNTQCF